MNNLFTLFYLMFLFGSVVASIFIIYHISRYSINKQSSTIMLVVFIFIILILLLINFSIFKNIDFDTIFNIANLNLSNQSF